MNTSVQTKDENAVQIKDLIENPNKLSANEIIETGLPLIEEGAWQDFIGEIDRQDKPHTLPSHIQFLHAVALMKAPKLRQALYVFTDILNHDSELPEWSPLVEYYKARCLHLTGEYKTALREYKNIAKEYEGSDDKAAQKAVKLSKRLIADVLMLQGQFKEALDMAEEAQADSEQPLSLIEAYRLKGHIYRFNLDAQKAQEEYDKALRVSKDNNLPALEARVLTNLAENLCWTLPSKPSEATQMSEKAVNANKEAYDPIEVGKALSAQSIALSLQDKTEDALATANKSIQLQTNNGYESGVVFGLFAKAVSYLKSGNDSEFARTIKSMREAVERVDGSYEFLLNILVALKGDEPEHNAHAGQMNGWLDFDKTVSTAKEVLKLA